MKPKPRANGSFYVQFSVDGVRKTLSLGKIPHNSAQILAAHISFLVEARKHKTPPPADTMAFVLALPPDLRQRLVEMGLTTGSESINFVDLFTAFIEDYNDGTKAPNTLKRINFSNTFGVEYFGKTPIVDIRPNNPECNPLMFFKFLKSKQNANSTWSKALSQIKQCFNWGVRNQLIEKNPIVDLRGQAKADESKKQYVTTQMVEEVLESVHSPDLELVICLARYGGLRIPSELDRLKWSNIDWKKEMMVVYAPKTGRVRRTPIFPQLLKRLQIQFERAADGSQFVIEKEWRTRPEINLRKGILTAINRANFIPWPKVFTNLRASIITDCLLDGIPIHVVTSWFGNSPKIALEHYATETSIDWKTAVSDDLLNRITDKTPKPFPKNEILNPEE